MQEALATDRRQQEGERQSQVALAGATIPHPTCTWPECPGISCDELWIMRVKQSVWSYQKTQPQGLLEGVAGREKLGRKNEWSAYVMESAVECFQRGSPKNYKRGSFDHLQNTKRRRLKLLPNSQKEPPPIMSVVEPALLPLPAPTHNGQELG